LSPAKILWRNAQEAIEGYLEVMHEDGLPIPTVHRDRVAVHAA
jgi:predicted RNase H-like HicB family nuclease